MCPRLSYEKKNMKKIRRKKNNFFASLKKGVGSAVGSESGSGSITPRGTDPRIRIRTKMSRNPNIGFSSLCSRPCIRPPCEQEGQDHGADVCHAEELCGGPQDSPGGNEGVCHALVLMCKSCKRMFCIPCRGPQDSPGENEGVCHALVFMC
jgi:hypothetical protein